MAAQSRALRIARPEKSARAPGVSLGWEGCRRWTRHTNGLIDRAEGEVLVCVSTSRSRKESARRGTQRRGARPDVQSTWPASGISEGRETDAGVDLR